MPVLLSCRVSWNWVSCSTARRSPVRLGLPRTGPMNDRFVPPVKPKLGLTSEAELVPMTVSFGAKVPPVAMPGGAESCQTFLLYWNQKSSFWTSPSI